MDTILLITILVLPIFIVISTIAFHIFLFKKSKEGLYIPPKEKKPKGKVERGARGEELVEQTLNDICDIKGGYTYKELKLEDKYGNWTEIDNIYISPYGVFLIETKNVRGIITGFSCDEKWRQTFPGGGTRTFSNPVLQNKRHIAFFQRMFPEVITVSSLVVFVDPDKLDIPKMNEVVVLSDLEIYFCGLRRIYSDSKVELINRKVKKYVDNPPFTHEQYKKWIQERYE